MKQIVRFILKNFLARFSLVLLLALSMVNSVHAMEENSFATFADQSSDSDTGRHSADNTVVAVVIPAPVPLRRGYSSAVVERVSSPITRVSAVAAGSGIDPMTVLHDVRVAYAAHAVESASCVEDGRVTPKTAEIVRLTAQLASATASLSDVEARCDAAIGDTRIADETAKSFRVQSKWQRAINQVLKENKNNKIRKAQLKLGQCEWGVPADKATAEFRAESIAHVGASVAAASTTDKSEKVGGMGSGGGARAEISAAPAGTEGAKVAKVEILARQSVTPTSSVVSGLVYDGTTRIVSTDDARWYNSRMGLACIGLGTVMTAAVAARTGAFGVFRGGVDPRG